VDVDEEEQIDTAIAISLTEGDIRSISMNPKANEQLHPDEIQAISAPDYCLKSSHINAAMYILQRQFPELGGFYKVQHGTDLTFPRESGGKWIQIIHSGQFHWVIAAYGFFNRPFVVIYDSASLNINHRQWDQISRDDLVCSHVLDTVSCLMRAEFNIARMPCQIQTGGSACGFFAVAFATSLAFGDDPSSVVFEQSKMVEHLQNCFQKKKMERFPLSTKRLTKHANAGMGRPFPVEVICSCRQRYSEKQKAIQCNECQVYFHQQCENVPDRFFLKKNEKQIWICSHCSSK
jgi:hypothetical protein